VSSIELEPKRRLPELLQEQCQWHYSAGWIDDWEHLAYDAVLSDGSLEYGKAGGRGLSDDALILIRDVAEKAGSWPVFCGFDHPDVDFNVGTRHVPWAEWKAMHEEWHQGPNGSLARASREWRTQIMAETAMRVEEIAELRDRIERDLPAALADKDTFPDPQVPLYLTLNKAATKYLMAWLPIGIRTAILVKNRSLT